MKGEKNMNKASKSKKTKAKPRGATKPPKSGTVAAQLITLTLRKSGVTHKEACAHLGWKQCRPYLFKVCAANGVRLRKEKLEDNTVRYFGSKRP